MTREEAIEILEEVKMLDDSIYAYNLAYGEALVTAIEMLKAQESCEDAVSRDAVMELTQSYGPATYDTPYGSGDMIIRPEDVKALPSVCPVSVARVMTLDEVRAAEVVWLEQVGACVCAIKIQNFDSGTMSFAYAHNNYTSFVNIKPEYYGIVSRCWTSRPADAQREAEPWS